MFSKACQPGCEAVQTKPTFGRESDYAVLSCRPTLILPAGGQIQILVRGVVTIDRPQAKIDLFGASIFAGELFLTFIYTLASGKSRLPRGVWRHVPFADATVERMRGRAGPNVIDAAPIRGVVA